MPRGWSDADERAGQPPASIDDVFGRFGPDLVQRVGEASDWPTRFALIDEALRVRLADAQAVDTGVAWSLRINASGGTALIGGLAHEPG